MKSEKFFLCLSLAITLLLILAQGTSTLVHAQEEFVLEEVTVTAEKREADLQKLPVPVSAITEETLVRQNVRQMFDLEKIVPDMEIGFNAASLTVISIRGVDAGDWGPPTDSPNVVHMDGAVLSRHNAIESHFFDIERVEVLKGPQGTLYGRGASAGTINIITRKPIIDTFSGYGEVEYGNYNLMRAEGAVNVPISDQWAMRTAFRTLKRPLEASTS